MMDIKMVYERYKHIDEMIEGIPQLMNGEVSFQNEMLVTFWRAIKDEVKKKEKELEHGYDRQRR